MERHHFLLVTTATCLALGLASFLVMPFPSPHYDPVQTDLFQVVTTSIFFRIFWSLGAMAMHIGILRQWKPPHELFSYDNVFLNWIFTVESLGLASAAVGLVYSERFRHSSCGGSSRPVCRISWELSSWLALAMAALSVVDALLLHWATRRRHCAAQAG